MPGDGKKTIQTDIKNNKITYLEINFKNFKKNVDFLNMLCYNSNVV